MWDSDFGNIVPGDFTPVLAKHTKSFNLIDTLSVGVDRIQRNFEPLQRQVETWRKTQITDETAKLILYSAFIDGKLEAPRSLLPDVDRLYFESYLRLKRDVSALETIAEIRAKHPPDLNNADLEWESWTERIK